jgi:hypothetical protein
MIRIRANVHDVAGAVVGLHDGGPSPGLVVCRGCSLRSFGA